MPRPNQSENCCGAQSENEILFSPEANQLEKFCFILVRMKNHRNYGGENILEKAKIKVNKTLENFQLSEIRGKFQNL